MSNSNIHTLPDDGNNSNDISVSSSDNDQNDDNFTSGVAGCLFPHYRRNYHRQKIQHPPHHHRKYYRSSSSDNRSSSSSSSISSSSSSSSNSHHNGTIINSNSSSSNNGSSSNNIESSNNLPSNNTSVFNDSSHNAENKDSSNNSRCTIIAGESIPTNSGKSASKVPSSSSSANTLVRKTSNGTTVYYVVKSGSSSSSSSSNSSSRKSSSSSNSSSSSSGGSSSSSNYSSSGSSSKGGSSTKRDKSTTKSKGTKSRNSRHKKNNSNNNSISLTATTTLNATNTNNSNNNNIPDISIITANSDNDNPFPNSILKSSDQNASESTRERYTSCRWVLAYMGSLMTLLVFVLRHCLSMALVCIANLPRDVTSFGNGSEASGGWGREGEVNISGINGTQSGDVLIISAGMQGIVLSSYFYGYVISPFIGGMAAERFGGKRVLTVAMATSAALTLVTPAAIRYSMPLTVVVRVLLGLSGGFCLPCITSMWSKWAPKEEKAKLLTITFSGSSTGSVVASLVSGFLCSIRVDNGWPFIFYTYGAVTLLWVLLWQFVAYDTPEQHPRMHHKERALLQTGRSSFPKNKKVAKPPMKAILTSPPFLSLLVSHLGYSWFLGTIATYLPIYLNDVMLFDTQTNGVMSSVPFAARLVASAGFAVLSDHLTTTGRLSVTSSRKLFQSIGLLVPAAVVVGVGYLDPEQRYVAVGMMVVVAAFQAACMVGFRINHLDIAPRFAGSLSGMTISFATASNIIHPLITSPIVADKQQASWRIVFYIAASIAVFGAVMFAFFGSGEEQEWAKEKRPSVRNGTWVVTQPDQNAMVQTDENSSETSPEDLKATEENQNASFAMVQIQQADEISADISSTAKV